VTEHRIQNEIRNALAGECLLFRANVGRAWTGNDVYQAKRAHPIALQPGDVVIRQARPFDTGLPPGFGDLFGLAPRIITAAMVGQKVGVYLAADVKSATGKLTDKQAAYLRAVNDNGGCADVWRSVADALATIHRAKGR
jgi:hypothetical protein